jgi:hypothetical protein
VGGGYLSMAFAKEKEREREREIERKKQIDILAITHKRGKKRKKKTKTMARLEAATHIVTRLLRSIQDFCQGDSFSTTGNQGNDCYYTSQEQEYTCTIPFSISHFSQARKPASKVVLLLLRYLHV